MNRTALHQLVTSALMLAATVAAAFSATQAGAAERSARTVRVATLPTVEVVARREVVMAPRVAQLPLVTVTARRPVAQEPTRVAQRPAAGVPRS